MISENMEKDYSEVLGFASDMGRLLMKYGAESSLAKSVMLKISEHYGVFSGEYSIQSNCIFTSETPKVAHYQNRFLKLDLYRLKAQRLQYVADLYRLSEEICEKNLSLKEAESRMDEIRKKKLTPDWMLALSAAVVAASYCLLLNASWLEVATAAVVGMFTKATMLFNLKRTSIPTANILGGFVATMLCLFAGHLGLCSDEGIIINSILVLFFPGLALVNGIRDTANLDYMTGLTNLIHAAVILSCALIGSIIAIGCDYAIFGEFGLSPLTQSTPQAWPWMLVASVAASVGISMLFHVPKRFHPIVGLFGIIGTVVKFFVARWSAVNIPYQQTVDMSFVGILFAITIISLLARVFQKYIKCPVTVLTIGTIIMMVPSPKIFWAMFCSVFNQPELAQLCTRDSLFSIVAIVTGILLAMEMPKLPVSLGQGLRHDR